jgi:hypothetical protein
MFDDDTAAGMATMEFGGQSAFSYRRGWHGIGSSLNLSPCAFGAGCRRRSWRWPTRWRQTGALDMILRRTKLMQVGSEWSINGPKRLGRNNAHAVRVAGKRGTVVGTGRAVLRLGTRCAAQANVQAIAFQRSVR